MVLNNDNNNCALLRSFRPIFLPVPCALCITGGHEPSSAVHWRVIISLHLRGMHVTVTIHHTSTWHFKIQAPVLSTETSYPHPFPPLLPHTPPPAPPPSLWTATKHQRDLIREENRTSLQSYMQREDYFCSRHTNYGLSVILLLPLLLLLLLLLYSPAEEPVKGSPPQHLNVRHHLSLSLCSPSISLSCLAIATDSRIDSSFLFLFLAWFRLSLPSTILLAAFPFQNGTFHPPARTSARLSRVVVGFCLAGWLSPLLRWRFVIPSCAAEKICWRW